MENIDICRACSKIIRPYIQQKIMGPLYYSTIQKALDEKRNIFQKEGEKIVGFILWKVYKKEPTLLLHKMALDQSSLGGGRGSEMLRQFIEVATKENRSIRLRVAKINSQGINFYRKHGFEIVDEEKNMKKITSVMFRKC